MTAVLETQASADTALASIAVGEIHPSPANPRRDLGDVSELADSIKELGIVEPLIVTPNGDGYVLVAGHRRHAAAVKAGMAEVPCIVRHGLDDRAQAELRIVENLHRQDLAPIEEAVAYQELIELGHSQRQLAKKVSRSQAHISRRLSLLKLPAPAIDALDSGRITIDEAITLARVPADKVAEVFKGRGSVSYEVGKVIREQEHEEKVAAARAELAKTGVTVVDTIPTPAWKHRLDGPDGYGHLRLSPEDHAGEPCHVAVIHWEKVEHYCTDPDRHASEGESELKAPVAEPEEDDDEEPADTPEEQAAQAARRTERAEAVAVEAERRGRRQEAIAARRAFISSALSPQVSAEDTLALVSALFGSCVYIEDCYDRRAAEFLGLDPDTFNSTSSYEQIKAYAAEGSRNRARAVAAACASMFEGMATPSEWTLAGPTVVIDSEDEEAVKAWFAWLVDRGYELTDHDRELIPEPEPPAEAQPDDAVAWYDDPEEGPRWVDESEAAAIADIDAARLQYLQTSRAPDQALPGDEPVGDAIRSAQELPTVTVKKVGKRWTVTCSACGDVGHNTTEAYADERGETHIDVDHRLVESEVSA